MLGPLLWSEVTLEARRRNRTDPLNITFDILGTPAPRDISKARTEEVCVFELLGGVNHTCV